MRHAVSGVVIVALLGVFTGTAVARTMTTPLPQGWESQILASLGAPVTPNNVRNLDAWQAAEGGSTANPDAYNPFNTTLAYGGSHGTNAPGVQAFPDWASGLHATVQTIDQQNMAPILAALRGDVQLPQFAASVQGSPWNTGPGKTDYNRIVGYRGSGAPVVDLSGVQLASATGPSPDVQRQIQTGDFIGAAPGAVATDFTGAAGKFFGQLITSGFVMRGTLIVAGLVILFIGLSQVSKVDGAGGTIASGTQDVRVHVISGANKAKNIGKAGAEA